MNKRRYLALIGLGMTLSIAGCAGDDDDNGDNGGNGSDGTPDAASLLPQPEDYTLTERNPQVAGLIGADNGMQGVYSDESGTEFSVEIIAFADEDAETAENNTSSYTASETWNLVVLHDNVIYAVSEISQKEARDVLATSPQLDRSTIEANTVS